MGKCCTKPKSEEADMEACAGLNADKPVVEEKSTSCCIQNPRLVRLIIVAVVLAIGIIAAVAGVVIHFRQNANDDSIYVMTTTKTNNMIEVGCRPTQISDILREMFNMTGTLECDFYGMPGMATELRQMLNRNVHESKVENHQTVALYTISFSEDTSAEKANQYIIEAVDHLIEAAMSR